MQLIEVSVTGVRSAVITFRRPDTGLRFLLFPMVHLGTPAYYQEVTERLRDCQVVVAEGVGGGRLSVVGALTMAYRIPARNKRLGVVVQDIDLRALAAAGAEVIVPDMTAERFRRGWRTVPLVQRLAVLALVPVFAIALRLAGTKRVFDRYLATEDLPSLDGQNAEELMPKLTALLTDDRDQIVSAALRSLAQARSGEDVAVGVVYGAAHMPAVVRELTGQGFVPRRAEWLSVLAF